MKSVTVALQCSGARAPEVVQHFYQIFFRVFLKNNSSFHKFGLETNVAGRLELIIPVDSSILGIKKFYRNFLWACVVIVNNTKPIGLVSDNNSI